MRQVHREAAALRTGTTAARQGVAEWRAPVLLVYVIAGASLIVVSAGPIATTLAGVLTGPQADERSIEACARLGLGLALTGLAIIGCLLAGQRLSARVGHPAIAATAFPIGFGALALALAASWAAGAIVMRPPPGIDGGRFLLGVSLILLGVAAEELLLRGLLQPVLVQAWGAAAGVPACALAFTMIHMVGGWGNPLSLLNIFLAGLWFGLLALRSGGLAAPVLAHFGYNWAEEMIFGASPNPGVGAFGSVIDLDIRGSTIWGGSVEGLNASVAVSLVLAALVATLAILPATRASSGGTVVRS